MVLRDAYPPLVPRGHSGRLVYVRYESPRQQAYLPYHPNPLASYRAVAAPSVGSSCIFVSFRYKNRTFVVYIYSVLARKKAGYTKKKKKKRNDRLGIKKARAHTHTYI